MLFISQTCSLEECDSTLPNLDIIIPQPLYHVFSFHSEILVPTEQNTDSFWDDGYGNQNDSTFLSGERMPIFYN